MRMGGGMDMGYSQRKFYIDADYDPYKPMNSYARGGRAYDMGNSMARGGNSYGYGTYDMGGSYADGGNSYMYYDPRYDQPMYSMARGGRGGNGGYSGTSSKMEMVEELKEMMGEATDQSVKTAIQDVIAKLNK